MFELTVPGKPIGKGRARITRFGSFTPKKTVTYERFIQWLFKSKYRRIKPLEGAVKIELLIHKSVNKYDSKSTKELKLSGKIRPTVKPDASNVLKIVEDALNGLAYIDDKQIVEVHIWSYYVEVPDLEIKIMGV